MQHMHQRYSSSIPFCVLSSSAILRLMRIGRNELLPLQIVHYINYHASYKIRHNTLHKIFERLLVEKAEDEV